MIVCCCVLVWLSNHASSQEQQESNAEKAFQQLTERYKARFKKFAEEMNKVDESKFDERSALLFLRNHPACSMVDDFLELEAENRGTKVGFSCLYHLVAAAGPFGTDEAEVTKGKQRALLILAEHYYDWPNVDTVFGWVFHGYPVEQSGEFLRAVIQNTDSSAVRANASFVLARQLALEANMYSSLQANMEFYDGTGKDEKLRRANLEKLLTGLSKNDFEKNRNEASTLIRNLEENYGDHLLPPRGPVRTPALVETSRGDSDDMATTQRKTIADKLDAVKFELNHGIGSKPPAIEGVNVGGEAMSLTQLQGKVVVLMFSAKACGPCERMYPENRTMVEELSGKPFAFVGVMGDETIDTVKQSIADKTITWPVWWDGPDGTIFNTWNIQGIPDTYVLDQHGTIRYRGLRHPQLGRAVEKLLNEMSGN